MGQPKQYRFYGLAVLLLAGTLGATRPAHTRSYLPAQSEDTARPEFEKRRLRYRPDGGDFVIVNGHKKYNRALYGTHTAFRVEAGDLPEFALFIPGIGGDMKLGVITPSGSKWLDAFDTVEARYRPGTMLYRLRDSLLGSAEIHLQVLATDTGEGMLVKALLTSSLKPLRLIMVYGGASGLHPSRNGDIGADPPSLFYLTPGHAQKNKFTLQKNGFHLSFPDKKGRITLEGKTPAGASLHVGDARHLQSPLDAIRASDSTLSPVVVSSSFLTNGTSVYFAVKRIGSGPPIGSNSLANQFAQAEKSRKMLAGRVRIHTPDQFLNTLGGTIAVAGDAIWQSPAYEHGAVAWRMWLNGWRGPYVANDLGWHDRAKTMLSAYNLMQLHSPDTTVVYPDPDKNLARQKEKIGVGLYNSGYITRLPQGNLIPNHYDMNLVYVDDMLRHFQWTGDTAFLNKCWPVLKRHLAWEKRNFDRDGNGLYDAYACIWASDALAYSAGDVAYSSAFNYVANHMAMRIAQKLGKDSAPYREEAEKIRHAMDSVLWIPSEGWYAEYKDRSGILHPDAGLWTLYHAIDSRVPDPFQTYQCLRYIDTHIPHIAIHCQDTGPGYYMLSTTDWMPYTWSVNNVAMAEMAHTALAYWEGDRRRTAFTVFKSLLLESMYLGSSPGNFEQLSYYDRYRGELYRDFADPIGICSRALVEGLFGIRPDALKDTLIIRPGFPDKWPYASIHLPDIDYSYQRNGRRDRFLIQPHFEKEMALALEIPARGTEAEVRVNERHTSWESVAGAVGHPLIRIIVPATNTYSITVDWKGRSPVKPTYDTLGIAGQSYHISLPVSHGKVDTPQLISIKDPQQVLPHMKYSAAGVSGNIAAGEGWHTFFIRLRQGKLTWWMPVNLDVLPPVQIVLLPGQDSTGVHFQLRNNAPERLSGDVMITSGTYHRIYRMDIAPRHASKQIFIPAAHLVPGTNRIAIHWNGKETDTLLTDWHIDGNPYTGAFEKVDLSGSFNDRVTQIFKHKYLFPRPDAPTLQLPEQGIGNWCSPMVDPLIDDKGLRRIAGSKNCFYLPDGIPFQTPSTPGTPNIAFTSRWKNYPGEIRIPLQGKASHAYLLMAGSTNPMQSRMVNGLVTVRYTDGSSDSLLLTNPGTWWPIEEDYNYDDYAFHCTQPLPYRVHLQSGLITRHFKDYKSIPGLTDLGVPGGAATVLDLPLDATRTLQFMQVSTVASEVIVGVMALTLLKSK